MTTIVYTKEVTTSNSPNSYPRNVEKLTVKIMEGGGATTNVSSPAHRAGSPKPQTKYSTRGSKSHGQRKTSKIEVHSHYPGSYNPHIFTITAYLPHDGGRRLKLHCTPGMTVQQVIEAEIPGLFQQGYQVYQFPSRALLNPEKDASILQGQEISIEPMKLTGQDEMGDERLALVSELLRTEDSYLENLKNIFDIYMEPLRKWGLPQSEMNILFRSLSRLCDLLMNFYSELELAVQYWNTNTTQIGGLFKQYPSFWAMYDEYSSNYSEAGKLLKEKRMMDESFNRFLEMKRGAAMHTLESLMLLPVQRVHDYYRILSQLYDCTPQDHSDYMDLHYTVNCVGRMVQDRENQLNRNQNEAKLDQVQRRFPNDSLKLCEPLEASESMYKRTVKGYGSPAVSSKAQSHTKKLSVTLDQPDSGRINGDKSMRLYLQEGPVKLITHMQDLHLHDRYFFLFDDQLLIAKPTGKQKSQHKTYKLKQRICLSDMWVADFSEEMLAPPLPSSTSFIIGWPITNCIAAFKTTREKELWKNLLSNHITGRQQYLRPDIVSVCIVNLTKSSNNIPAFLQVRAGETAKDVLLRALEHLAIAVAAANCQLWVKYSKDDTAVLLLGHEYPFAIQAHHNRNQVDYVGEPQNRPSQLQFLIKRKTSTSSDVTPTHAPRLRRIKTPNLRLWWGKNKSRYSGTSSSSSRRKKLGVFGAPLETVIVNDQLPEILQEMLVRLFMEGPSTLGIFRQSANHRKVKEMKEAIDNRERVDISECAIHVVGALLKELLRSVPRGMLESSRYTEFVATNDIKDIPTRVQHIQKILGKIPKENQLFLSYLLPLLHYISTKDEINCMNSINLAICFAPSLLWPDSGLDVIKNEVPPLVQFMIEHCPAIFGEELPELYKQATLASSPGVENMEFSLDREVHYVPTKREDGGNLPILDHKRTDSMDTYSSEDSQDEDNMSSLRRARNSGLTLSDSQLSTISQLEDYELQAESSRRFGAVGTVHLMGRMIAKETREAETRPISPFKKLPAAKRVKRSHRPERSSSYRSAKEKPLHARLRYQSSADYVARRKSIATQTTLPRKNEFTPEFPTIPPSPNSSMSSSSQGVSPHVAPRLKDGTIEEESPKQRRHSKKQRRGAPVQYSHSFSKSSDNMPQKPIPTSASTSFYDKLLPRDQDARIRSRSMGNTNVIGLRKAHEVQEAMEQEESTTANMTWPTHQKDQQQLLHEPIINQMRKGSSQSIASTISSASSQTLHSYPGASSQTLNSYPGLSPLGTPQHRPSNQSLASGHSGGSTSNQISPDPAADLDQIPLNKMDKEFLKVAISNRFSLGGDPELHPPPQHPHPLGPYTGRSASFNTSTPYSHGSPHSGGRAHKQRSESFQHEVSIENVQKKFHERRSLDHSSAMTPFKPTGMRQRHSIHGFHSQQAQRKRDEGLDVVLEGLDDRPESEQHLNSLPRPQGMQPRHSGFVPMSQGNFMKLIPSGHPMPPPELLHAGVYSAEEPDPNRLYPGYNSDTESSPSRTLSRPEKLKEVTSPGASLPTKSMPQRYYKTHSPSSSAQIGTTAATPAELSKRMMQQALPPGSHAVFSHTSSRYDQLQPLSKMAEPACESQTRLPQEALTEVVEAVQDDAVVSINKRKSVSKIVGGGQNVEGEGSGRAETEREGPRDSRPSPSRTRSKTVHGDSKVEKLLGTFKAAEKPDMEDVKVKLGLIAPRQRSKSTSESEAMKVLHRLRNSEEEEEATSLTAMAASEEERAEKHKEWLSCVPSPHERRRAWENISKNTTVSQNREARARSVKQDQPSPVPTRAALHSSPIAARKSSHDARIPVSDK